jgi:hypothetical protein
LPPANTNAHKTIDLYPGLNPVTDGNEPVLCDTYRYAMQIGMPVLYYRADTSAPGLLGIYNYMDNQWLVGQNRPWPPYEPHALNNNEALFRAMIQNQQIPGPPTPHRTDSFILMSAGEDGVYGTGDDVFNF